ncbi:MAG: rhomboid family intramembrane serine protease [Planctomycetes bacterium]|nr:rhomboid family intramembrane serine protease [Planctomycetota bacterium]
MSYEGASFPRLTPAIKQLLLVNAAVFLANMLLLGRLSAPTEAGGGFWLAFSWPAAWEGFGLGWLRLITYQFTHSFTDPWHVLMNMLMLYFFGTLAEMKLGYRGTWKVYLLSGIAGALVHLLLAALQGQTSVPLVGASGACYGLLLYAACLAPHSPVILLIVRIPLWLLAALLVGLGVYSTFIGFATGFSGGVAHGAHLGGAALGWLAYQRNWFCDYVPYEYQSNPIARLRNFWRGKRAAAQARAAADAELQLDEILAKVKQSGLSSLSAAERRFLERTSQDRAGRRDS